MQVRFDGGGVAGVFGQGVEMREMAACAVKKEAENLFEQFINRRSLGVFAHGAEEAVKMR